MSAGAPWSVKGIDPKAREVAKDLARRSGMTLGEWLNRVILEDDIPDEVTNEADFDRRSFQEPTRRMALAGPHATPELARISMALDRVTDRLEASETRTGLAIAGVEHSVRDALARLETAEREQLVVAARLDQALDESGAQHARHAERLSRLEVAAGPRSPEALQMLEARIARIEPEAIVEQVLDRLTERLAAAEARTEAAMGDLREALGRLDARMIGAEPGQFEALAEGLSRQVEAVRADVAAKLSGATGEAGLADMTGHVRVAGQRATDAVEALGRQVLTMAEAVSRKLTDVDQRSADAIDQVGSEVARIAAAVEQRLARQEAAQAESFARLRSEFSISYPAPARAAPEPFPRRTPEAASRHVRASSGPAAWLAGATTAAPEPTAPAAVTEAPETAPEALAEATAEPPARIFPDDAPEQPEWMATLLGEPPEPESEAETLAAFGPGLFARAETESQEQPLGEPVEPPGAAERDDDTVEAAWRRLDLDAPGLAEPPDSFAPLPEDDDAPGQVRAEAKLEAAAPDDEDLFEPDPPAVAPAPELSTREVIDRARAAARAARGPLRDRGGAFRAKVGHDAASGRMFRGFAGKPTRHSSAVQTALMLAGGAAFLSVGAAGLTLMQGSDQAEEAVAQSPLAPQARAAVALAPAGFAPGPDVTEPPEPPVFAQVRADVEAGAPGAVDRLKALAVAHHPQAQLYLAQLYDAGEAGLAPDPAEARRLTQMAAASGEPRAMHNLGVYFFRGEGGSQDLPGAVTWFERAAAAGVVESQYNLGLLYQSGSGVPRDLAEARRWFSAAAAGGDAQARQALAQISQPAGPTAR